MKRLSAICLLVVILLCSCDTSITDVSSEYTSNISSEKNSDVSSDYEEISSEASIISEQPPIPYPYPTINDPIEAYNEFLLGNLGAVDGDDILYVTQLMSLGSDYEGIDNYAFYDITSDGIPELLTRSLFLDIFTHKDGRVVHIFESKFNVTNGYHHVLENGAVFSCKSGLGYSYFYTEFFADGSQKTTTFDGYLDDPEWTDFHFENERVTREEWISLTNEFFKIAENVVEIDWTPAK